MNVYDRVEEHYNHVALNASGTPIITYLQGSQNYGLADEESDVDTKTLVIPTFTNLVLSKARESHTLVLPNNEHADVKDAQLMFQAWRKQNVNFVECLYTPYVYYEKRNEWINDALYCEREKNRTLQQMEYSHGNVRPHD